MKADLKCSFVWRRWDRHEGVWSQIIHLWDTLALSVMMIMCNWWKFFFLPFSSTHFLPFLEQIQTHSSWKTVGLLKKNKKTDVALGWMFITTKRCILEILARCYFIFCSISLMSWITKRKYINEGGRERNKNKTNSSPLQYITPRNI